MRKLIAFILLACITFSLLAVGVGAAEANRDQTDESVGVLWFCEEDLSRLIISGKGSLEEFVPEGTEAPWAEFGTAVSSVVIHEGITDISTAAFEDLSALTEIMIPTSVTSIADNAFANCVGFSESYAGVYYLGTEEEWAQVEVGDGNENLLSALSRTEKNESDMKWSVDWDTATLTVSGHGTMDFYGDFVYLVSPWEDITSYIDRVIVEDGVTAINRLAFAYIDADYVSIPASVKEIGEHAFHMWYGTTINYGGTMAQWEKAIEDVVDIYCHDCLWDELTVVCSDGTLGEKAPVTPEPSELPYKDIKDGAWYYDAVKYVSDNSLMNGVAQGNFSPDGTMTRAMVVTVLYRIENPPAVEPDELPFTDLTQPWYLMAVEWAYRTGIVNGVSENKFDPDGEVTREQLATMLYRYCEYKNYNVSNRADLKAFPDSSDVSAYATDALSWANAEGLVNGNNIGGVAHLDPRGDATRAQVATILMRFCEKF